MKWCFLLNEVPFLMKFLGKLAHQVVEEGDECIVLVNSKIAQYGKQRYFPPNARFLSKVDWCAQYYQKSKDDFGPLAWRDLFADFDRFPMFPFNYTNSVEIISQLYQFIDFALQKEKPDVIINEPPSNTCTEIIYLLSEKYHIPYLGFAGSRFNGYIDIYDTEFTNSRYAKEFREMDNRPATKNEQKFAQAFMRDFLSHDILPSYQKLSPASIFKRLKGYIMRQKRMMLPWLAYSKERNRLHDFDYESELVFRYNLSVPWIFLKSYARKFSQKNIFEKTNLNDDFFLFPLQLQPEASISVLATYLSDQVNTVKNIAFCLPLPYKLYVKEHPSSIAHRSQKFYRELKKIPNIVLVSPHENVSQLIKRSQGVITLTSTVGMEAMLTGKRTYVLGEATYAYHPLCKRIFNFEELKQEISNDLSSPLLVADLENTNIRFVISYFRHAIPGIFEEAEIKNDSNDYRKIYETVKKLLP